jgi:acetyl esterase
MEEPSPSIRRVLARLADMPVEKGTAEELGPARARRRARAIWADFWSGDPPAVDRVVDCAVPTSEGEVPVRLYDPASDRRRPLVYVHGGGFVVGDLDTHDVMPRHLALYSGRPVISVGYRLAPEFPYPTPVLDIVATVEAIAANAAGLDIDGAGLTLAGDSAGASLALSAALRLRDTPAAPSALLLFFGCYDPGGALASRSAHANGYGLAASDIRWFWRQYLGDQLDRPPPDVAPLEADLRGLPPVYLGVGDCDPLRADTEMLAARLRESGAAPLLRIWPGMIHGCVGMVRMVNEAHAQLADAAVWIANSRP